MSQQERERSDRQSIRDRLLRYGEVKLRVGGYTRQHLGRLEKQGRFPKRVQIGPGTVGWPESEIDAWIEARKAARLAA